MALAQTAKGVQILVKVGDGGDPETFAHNCSINGARSFQLSAGTNEISVPDCDDPNLMSWLVREKVSLGGTVQGAGVLNTPDLALFEAWARDRDAKNCRVVVDVPGAAGGGYWSGAFHCTDLTISGDVGASVDISVTLVSTGELVFTTNA